jgi:hypothetical protein
VTLGAWESGDCSGGRGYRAGPKMVSKFKLGHFVHVKMILGVEQIVVQEAGNLIFSRRNIKLNILCCLVTFSHFLCHNN